MAVMLAASVNDVCWKAARSGPGSGPGLGLGLEWRVVVGFNPLGPDVCEAFAKMSARCVLLVYGLVCF